MLPPTEPAAEPRFDGRDVTDGLPTDGDVLGYELQTCPYCGTRRSASLPFCCELAEGTPPARELAFA
jgi:hypothetical protein